MTLQNLEEKKTTTKKLTTLTHFLPNKLCTTYSYAQVKFDKIAWCHKKQQNTHTHTHKTTNKQTNKQTILYAPIFILSGGNVV
jgi:hypothetical protein